LIVKLESCILKEGSYIDLYINQITIKFLKEFLAVDLVPMRIAVAFLAHNGDVAYVICGLVLIVTKSRV